MWMYECIYIVIIEHRETCLETEKVELDMIIDVHLYAHGNKNKITETKRNIVKKGIRMILLNLKDKDPSLILFVF